MSDSQFVLKLDLAATPKAVFASFTEATELSRWFAPHAEVTPGIDGRIELKWDDEVKSICQIQRWEPPHHLAMTWAEGDALDTTVQIDLSGGPGVCELRLIHRGFEDGDQDAYHSIARGWTVETRILRHYLQRFRGSDRYLRMERIAVPDMTAGRWRALAQRLSMPDPAVLRQGQHFPIHLGDSVVPGATLQLGIVDEDLLLELDALHGGLLRLSVESVGPGLQLWIWVMAWNDQRQAVDGIFDHLAKAVRNVA